MPPVGFEPTISAGERPKTYALDRAATGTGIFYLFIYIYPQILTKICNIEMKSNLSLSKLFIAICFMEFWVKMRGK